MRRYGLPVVPAIIGDHPRPGRRGAAAPGAADQRRRALRPRQHAVLDGRLRHRRPPARGRRVVIDRVRSQRGRGRRRRRHATTCRTLDPPARQPGRSVTMAIVVGYVPRPEGQAALDRAIEEATPPRHPPRGPQRQPRRRPRRPAVRLVGRLGRGQGQARRVRGRARGRPGVEARDPADQLLRVAEETNAELIVIGLRRRTPVGKLIMGSAAQTVLLEAEAPVLAVKAPKE